MSFEQSKTFTKDNLDYYLKELGKEYRHLNGKAVPAEIVLIGGAAILAKYGFRDMTTDVDAIIHASSSMKEAINRVGDRFGLPNGWLNMDFAHTGSYSPKLNQYSTYYRKFSNVLTVRTISAEYLVAMKLRSGRKYKNDYSDILGILAEHEKANRPIRMEEIKQAVVDLYGSWETVSADSRSFILNAMKSGDFVKRYEIVKGDELYAKDMLVQFEQEHPGVINAENVDTFLMQQKSEESRAELLARLKAKTKDDD